MNSTDKAEIVAAFKEVMKEYNHPCRFDLTDAEAHQITAHLAGIIALGEGDLAKGFTETQANHRFTQSQRKFSESMVKKILFTIVGTLGLVIVWAIWEGVKHFMFDSQGNK